MRGRNCWASIASFHPPWSDATSVRVRRTPSRAKGTAEEERDPSRADEGLLPRHPPRPKERRSPCERAPLGIHARPHHERRDHDKGDLPRLLRPDRRRVGLLVAEGARSGEPRLSQEARAGRGFRLRHADAYPVAALEQKVVRDAFPEGGKLEIEGRKTDRPTARAVADVVATAGGLKTRHESRRSLSFGLSHDFQPACLIGFTGIGTEGQCPCRCRACRRRRRFPHPPVPTFAIFQRDVPEGLTRV